jgi:hypothetical protein
VKESRLETLEAVVAAIRRDLKSYHDDYPNGMMLSSTLRKRSERLGGGWTGSPSSSSLRAC